MIRNVLLLGLLCLFGSTAWAAEDDLPAPRDYNLEALQRLPVHDGGRIKPFDTFAREKAFRITQRSNPRLTLDEQEVKFTANQLLLSWLMEEEKWFEVRFIRCDHPDVALAIRYPEYFDRLIHPEKFADDDSKEQQEFEEWYAKEKVKDLHYVSPAEILDAPEILDYYQTVRAKIQQAEKEFEEYKPTAKERAVSRVLEALEAYSQIVFYSLRANELVVTADRKALVTFVEAAGEFRKAFESLQTKWQQDPNLQPTKLPGEEFSAAKQRFVEVNEKLSNVFQTPNPAIQQIDPVVREYQASVLELTDLLIDALPEDQAQDFKNLRPKMERLHSFIYYNSNSLRLVPALHPEAYERDRDMSNLVEPWLDLQTILHGSENYFQNRGYDFAHVQQVRAHFKALQDAYLAKNESAFDRQLEEFTAAVRHLGKDTADKVLQMEVKDLDEEVVALVDYPNAGYTQTELTYNEVQPFFWSWVISLISMILFALAFGWIRAPMLWLGFFALLGAIGVSIYGFSLRIAVTGWAPVTNMYETVIYVGSFVSILGAWFLMLPITGEGLRMAWKLTAAPGTPEAEKFSEKEQEVLSEDSAFVVSAILMVPRLALMAGVFWLLSLAPYAAGGNTIINLLPNQDIASEGLLSLKISAITSLSSSELMVWLVGLCMLAVGVWFVPRALLTLASGFILVPMTLLDHGEKLFPKLYEHPRPLIGVATAFCGFFAACVAWFAPPDILNPNFQPLQPILRDNFWLTIHVLTIVSSYGAGALAWALGNLALGYYLFGSYRSGSSDKQLSEEHRPASELLQASSRKRPPAACLPLVGYVYKAIQVAVLLLAAGTILGGLWADVSWGRFWGWDAKEVWALVSLLIYLAILHGRYAGWFGNFGLVAGAVWGFSGIVMSWYGVNFWLSTGLHSYGFGSGAPHLWVVGVVVGNWVFLCLAWLRYMVELENLHNPFSSSNEQQQISDAFKA